MINPKKLTDGSINLIESFKTYKYNRDYLKNNINDFLSFGTLLFCGEMGSGKSLSAHKMIAYLKSVKPDLLVISNIDLYYCDYVKYIDVDTIRNADNGTSGIILFFDEIQNQFPSVDSKSIARDYVEICSFLRKYRILIVGTAPIFSRIAKPFRESFEVVCFCDNCLFGLIQHNQFYKCNVETKAISDGDEENIHNMKLIYNHFFSRKVDDYTRYNTYEVVKIIGGDRKC